MSILRWFGQEPLERSKQASDKLDAAIDDLSKTVQMNRTDFSKMLDVDRKHLEVVNGTVQFDTFADICEFRYAPANSALMRLCKHEGHEARGTGIASCNASQCPRLRGK